MKLNLEVILSVAGKEVYRKRHDGFCRAAGSHIRGWWHASTGINVPDTSNVSRNPGGGVIRFNAPAGTSTYGPVVGTGTTAVDWDDYKLDTQIAHGTGTGQLQYGLVTFNAPTTSGSDRFWEVIRTFDNGSGAQITVNEIGLYSYSGTYYFCWARDVLSSGVDVPDGQTLTVTYKVKVTL